MKINIKRDFERVPFHVARHLLLSKNTLFNLQIKNLKKSPKKEMLIRQMRLCMTYDLNPKFISDYTFEKEINFLLIDYHPNLLFVGSPNLNPDIPFKKYIREGMYIRVEPDMDEDEFEMLYKHVKDMYKSELFDNIRWRKQHGYNKDTLDLYLYFEKLINITFKAKLGKHPKDENHTKVIQKDILQEIFYTCLKKTFNNYEKTINADDVPDKFDLFEQKMERFYKRYNLPYLKKFTLDQVTSLLT